MTMGNFDSRLLVSIIFEHSVKVDLHSIYPFFVRFCTFFFHEKNVLFRLHFYMFISALTKLSHTGQKFFKKQFL